ncbi:hypothetical protein GE061_002798 [Apolygus lucorum]|uniref:Peptidase S1 domain-containing protein n=1 Tax=Apolygus lucorum TaxID=248454 RepID=A0A8S9X636_APOLU|nr:hypothetical protein GE061_002798 [Apolygus lucorum]
MLGVTLFINAVMCFIELIGTSIANRTGNREKRVVYGSPLLYDSEYYSTKYYVWIGNGNECDIPLPDILQNADSPHKNELPVPSFGFACTASPNHLVCSGSLLVSHIVQTACHCVVDFVQDSSARFGKRATKINVNEKRYNVYPAKSLVSEMKNRVSAERYLFHPRCKERSLIVSFDYALVILDNSFSHLQRATAPAYSLINLVKLWTDMMSNRKICLVVGFGGYQATRGPLSRIMSPVMLHGWQASLDYTSCYENIKFDIRSNEFFEEGTVFCLSRMPNRPTRTSSFGDSGGPISCDNEYIGIVGSGTPKMSFPSPVVYTPLENAWEYRRTLVDYVENINDVMYTTDDPIGYKYLPAKPPINDTDNPGMQLIQGIHQEPEKDKRKKLIRETEERNNKACEVRVVHLICSQHNFGEKVGNFCLLYGLSLETKILAVDLDSVVAYSQI